MARAKSAAATGEKKTTTRAKKTAVPANGNTTEVHVPTTINLEDRIRVRAYEIYLSRGREDGAHESDWFAAEAEVRSRTA
jgi:Protein of unknown function (DUF2934)